METSTQPPRREPRRAIYVDDAPLPVETSAGSQENLDSNTSEQSDNPQPPQNESLPAKSARASSVSTTPVRFFSSRHPTTASLRHTAAPTRSSGASRQSTHSRSFSSGVANPPASKQPEIEKQIDMEMEDAVFLDHDFVQDFLAGNSERLEQVLEDCQKSSLYSEATEGWLLPTVTQESELYKPIVRVLNTIKRAVDRLSHNVNETNDGEEASNCTGPDRDDDDDTDGETDSDDEFQSISRWFLDHSASAIPSDDVDSTNIKPDIVLFEGQHRHWETVRMAIEVKANPRDLREGMKQLSRYARAMYAHQLHRRHLYGLVVCGSKVTFVRYDRAGIIHSPEIDICESFEVFTQAFASLLMLGRQAEGYDIAFTTTTNESGRLDYCVDLPESAFEGVSVEPSVAGPSGSAVSEGGTRPGPRVLPTRRFKVVERLCHRKSIRGRATIVLRIREVVESDEATDKGKGKGKEKGTTGGSTKKRKADEMNQQEQPHYILKLIWRDPLRESEGDVMKILRGMFALAQHLWHSDVAGECVCGAGWGCGSCLDETPRPANLVRSPIMGYQKAAFAKGRATKSSPASTSKGSGDCVRKHRIYSRILISSVGEPMWVANSAEEFLTALLDAILGYWRLVNLGILHRDISDGNILLLRGVQQHLRREWLEEHSNDVEALREEFGDMAESEAKLRKVLNSLNRNPSGMVSDFDLHTKHSSAPLAGTSDDTQLLAGESSEAAPLESSLFSNSQTASDHDSIVQLKRLKISLEASESVTTPSREKGAAWLLARFAESDEKPIPELDGGRPLRDFRTGTPTFMSLRVLRIGRGVRYTHNFMDDLESFFWLLVWSVAAHLDSRKDASEAALNTLQMLDNDNLEVIGFSKNEVFTECSSDNGRAIFKRLRSFENEWARTPSIILLVFTLGEYLHSKVYLNRDSIHDPSTVFPEIVNMISDALAMRSAQ